MHRTIGVPPKVRTTRAGIAVNLHDGRDLDAVVRADASIVLGPAAGVLTLDDTLGLVDIEGDEAAVRAVFNPGRAGSPSNGQFDQPADEHIPP